MQKYSQEQGTVVGGQGNHYVIALVNGGHVDTKRNQLFSGRPI